MTNDVRFIHLRTRTNGVAQQKGGYTIACKKRDDGNWALTICQCNSNQTYDGKLGEKVAAARMKRGQYFVQSDADMQATLNTLHAKLCTGTVPRLNLDEVTEPAKLAA
jgi:hypothetical protein